MQIIMATQSSPYQLLSDPVSLSGDTTEFHRQCCQLNKTFVSILQRIYRLLESRGSHGASDTVDYLIVYLLARLQPLSASISDHLNTLVTQQTFDRSIFLATHLSWFNYEFLEALVGVFLRSDVKASYQLVAYRERMKELGMTTLCEVASSGVVFGVRDAPGTCCLSVWLDHTHKNYHLHDIHHLRKTLSTALGKNYCPLYLTSVETSSSCTLLCFLVLNLFGDELFPLQESNLHILRNAGIVRVECGDYTWEEPVEKIRRNTVAHSTKQLILSDIDDPLWFENNSTPLHAAWWRGLTEEVKWLIKNIGYKALKQGKHGWSPLHAAAYGGHHHIVSLLLSECQCAPGTVDDDNVTALHMACFKGHMEIVTYLIKEKGVSPHISDALDGALVHYAAEGGQLEVLKFLVEECGCSLTVENAYGSNPYLVSCLQPNVSVIEYILQVSQGNPLFTDNDNQCALHYATGSDSPAVFHYLEQVMGSGFNLLATDDKGSTPCHYASGSNSLNLVRRLAEHLQTLMLTPDKNKATPVLVALSLTGYSGSQIEAKLLSCKSCRILGKPNCVSSTWNPDTASHQINVITFLLNNFKDIYDIQSKDMEGANLLHYSARSSNLELAKTLISEYGMDPGATTYDGRTAVSFAALCGCTPLIKYFQEYHQLKTTDVDVQGRTLLHHACIGGSLSTVQYLTEEEKLDCLQKDVDNVSPFHIACRRGHLSIVQYLVEEHYVDIKQRFALDGHQALHSACDSGNIELFDYLKRKCISDIKGSTLTGYTCLHYASFAGNLALVKILIREHHINKNAKTTDGFTPLHAASHDGHKAVVRYLIEECNVDPMLKSVVGLTPLHLACRNGHKHVVDLLVSRYGCDINVTNFESSTPLIKACSHGHTAVVRYLTNHSTCTRPTPFQDNDLHLACRAGGKLSLVKFLIEECQFSFDLKAPCGNGLKAIHLAAEKGFLDIVRYLIESNVAHCDPSSRTLNGLTPLHCAARAGKMDIVRYLTTVHRCNPKASTIGDHTPIDAAIQGEHWDIMEYLLNCK